MNKSSTTWVYLRKSRDEENDPHILDKHRTELLRIAEQRNIRVSESDILFEIGSGDDIAHRPVFRHILGTWEKLPRDHGGNLLTTEVSRATRGMQSQRGYVQDLLTRVHIIHHTRYRQYDLRQHEDITAWEMEAFLAAWELRMFKSRMASAKQILTRRGRPLVGGDIYGYNWDKEEKTYRPHPEQFPIIQAALRDLRRYSITRAALLHGIPRHILAAAAANPVYCGWPAVRFGRHNGSRQCKSLYWPLPREEWRWPEQPGDYPPAISRGEWEELQQMLASRRCQRESSSSGWCRDLVRFTGYLDRRTHLSAYTYRGVSTPSYACEPAGIPRLYVLRSPVHEAAEEAIRTALEAPEMLSRALDRYRSNRMDMGKSRASTDVAEIDRRLTRKRAELDRYRRELAEEENKDRPDLEEIESLQRVRADVRQEIEGLKLQLQRAQAAVVAVPELDAILGDLPSLAAGWERGWSCVPEDVRRMTANAFLSLIEVTVIPGANRKQYQRIIHPPLYRSWLEPFMTEIPEFTNSRKPVLITTR